MRLLTLGMLSALVLAACAPTPLPQAPGSGAARAGAESPRTVGPSRVRVAIGAEVDNLSTKLGGGTNAAEYNFMTNSPLVLRNAQGQAMPLLAAELPARENGTWVVNPDGTMRTTWKIRPHARWHDGQPVVTRDFVFAHQVYLDAAMPIANRQPEQFIARLEPVDEQTFVLHWKQLYPWANELVQRELEPLPAHLMERVYAVGDPEQFLNHRFWSSADYVGTGPYRLVQWDQGVQQIYRAFDDYFLGRPQIDEVIFRIIPDTNTMLANLLAGEVDTAVGATSLGQQAGATLKEQWTQTGGGEVFITPVRFRHTQIQFDPAYLEQPALLDVRVRRALVHALDRESMAQVVSAGLSPATEIYLTPSDPLYAEAQPIIARYPYDPNRALALLREAGWVRAGAEPLVDARGEPFKLDIRTTASTDNQTELSIMAADLAQVGMQLSQTVIPQSRIGEAEYVIKFPGLNNTGLSIQTPDTLRRGITAECPDPNRRYAGGNRGCWSHTEFDRLYEVASSSLDPGERGRAVTQALKILTEDVGLIGLFYTSENIPVRTGLVGPGPRWPGQIGNTWNIHEWTW
jgi:peptide/nickel transport system substrate-binding protein